ncbi:MAG: hypothetical protein EKK32_23030 [Bradyrhizobiaceae bacterium]|nr:MAG: hypothetical protein EKK32_23030 [Bradyrhizobiaceae bacterium]
MAVFSPLVRSHRCDRPAQAAAQRCRHDRLGRLDRPVEPDDDDGGVRQGCPFSVIARSGATKQSRAFAPPLDRVASLAMTAGAVPAHHRNPLRAETDFACPTKLICPVQSFAPKYSTSNFQKLMVV